MLVIWMERSGMEERAERGRWFGDGERGGMEEEEDTYAANDPTHF